MKTYASFELGLIAFVNDDAEHIHEIYAANERSKEFCGSKPSWPLIRWVETPLCGVEQLKEDLADRHTLAIAYMLARSVLFDLSDELISEVVEEIDMLLQKRINADKLMSNLLIEPLKTETNAIAAASVAASEGYQAVSAFYDELVELQPFVRKLSALWLRDAPTLLHGFSRSSQWLWKELCAAGYMKGILTSEDSKGFVVKWKSALFDLFSDAKAQDRESFTKAGARLSALYHGEEVSLQDRNYNELLSSDIKSGYYDQKEFSRETYDREWRAKRDEALLVIENIGKLLAKGEDSQARQYANDLVEKQIQDSGSEHAIKSLCNLAKLSADLFRLDMERYFLEQALEIDSKDSYALTQYADMHKRMGDYENAERILNEAIFGDDRIIAISNLANVYTSRQDYVKARETYHSIGGWEEIPSVRTALADILRYDGNYPAASEEYARIKMEFKFDKAVQDRASIGIAEIQKRQGLYEESLELYNEVIADNFSRDMVVYQMAKCHLLKVLGRLASAYRICDKLIAANPFNMQARLQRSAILAMSDRTDEVFQNLIDNAVGYTSSEWRQSYLRGLYLLNAERNEEAKTELLSNLRSAVVDSSDKDVARFALAFVCTIENDYDSAKDYLSQLSVFNDWYSEALGKIVALHLAQGMQDQESVQKLYDEVCSMSDTSGIVMQTANAILRDAPGEGREMIYRLLLCAA